MRIVLIVRMDHVAVGGRVDGDVHGSDAVARGIFAGTVSRFVGADAEIVTVAGVNVHVTAIGVDGDVRAGRNRFRGQLLHRGGILIEHADVDGHVRMAFAEAGNSGHATESEHHQDEQRGFATREQRRPVFVSLLRGEIVDELCDAPEDQE